MLEIQKCTICDIPAVMDFIDRNWKKDHILATSKALMDWQHNDDKDPRTYNWIIAKDNSGIQGILGYIPVSKYDPNLDDERFTWLALWKIIESVENRGVGLRLLLDLSQKRLGAIGVLGLNPEHPPMYRALGYEVGKLSQFFVCNPEHSQTLITSSLGFKFPYPSPGKACFKEVNREELLKLNIEQTSVFVPQKTPTYFANRYLTHPLYQYKVYSISLHDLPLALLATRLASHNQSRVLRIIDYLGNPEVLAACGSGILEILRNYQCEYADFWNYGISEDILVSCGFQNAEHETSLVVPNYFEPYLAKSARIEFAIKGIKPSEKLLIFRGDGDQDRPNTQIAKN